MNALSSVLKTRRKELGLTLAQIADKMGVSEATVQRWESGNIKSIRYEKVGKLSSILGVQPSDLMGWTDETISTPLPSNVRPVPTMQKVPRIGTIACGYPLLAQQNIEGYDAVPEYVRCDFTLVCRGDSMINARIFDGDIVCIREQPEVENGEIAAVLIDSEEATLKRVKLYEDHIVLEPENPMYKPMVFWGEEMNSVRILGKATHFISALK